VAGRVCPHEGSQRPDLTGVSLTLEHVFVLE
jgi:hypothetical protein